jgi:hypothetical protein
MNNDIAPKRVSLDAHGIALGVQSMNCITWSDDPSKGCFVEPEARSSGLRRDRQ